MIWIACGMDVVGVTGNVMSAFFGADEYVLCGALSKKVDTSCARKMSENEIFAQIGSGAVQYIGEVDFSEENYNEIKINNGKW